MGATLLLAGCSGAGGTVAAPAQAPAVEAVRVAIGRASSDIEATGRVARRREMNLSFRVPGVLTSLRTEQGDVVHAGQVLATLDPAGVAAAEQRASADLERARRDLARDEALFEKGFVSRQRLDDRRSAVQAAQASFSAAAFDRRWATLVSPVSGVVLERGVQTGEVVQPGQMVLRVADEGSPLVMWAPVPDREAGRIRPGSAAMVTLDGAAAHLTGRVTRVGERSGARTGAVDVEIELPAMSPELRSGQMGRARLAVAPEAAAAASPALARLPAEAIIEAQGRTAAVLIVDAGGKARRRTVSFGGFDGDHALVGGLVNGTQVITAGAGFVSDGDAVRVVDPSRLAPQRAAAR
ncbi:efflux RND transporter periplasmic adaptor subunit [Phenylobacterium sp. J426]|uniref:efflux RND transporter periplasmic adaptor subunit n=1 Tax=Phenylobacterium sp. J426 TaxID=2898439 RepID=UPI002151F7AE|nr:efflux RND transporter periplasmic adaptor subunit [Phenylobacterium sp. J426]MCR5876739.1 efflux RND transporter periplasmic adaptor subunit [Phenylobacterium sp. J426]